MFKKLFYSNTRKPKGFLGNMMINKMNLGHDQLTNWGLSHLYNIEPKCIADLGCGGGITVSKLIKKFSNANVTGVDYSKVSVKRATQQNHTKISEGMCSIVQGDVSNMKFDNNKFDLITAVETIYFWPGPLQSFQEVYRVLKEDGKFLIINEFDGVSDREQKYEKLIDGLKLYSQQELKSLLFEVGFKYVTMFHDTQKHWLCVLATK